MYKQKKDKGKREKKRLNCQTWHSLPYLPLPSFAMPPHLPRLTACRVCSVYECADGKALITRIQSHSHSFADARRRVALTAEK